MADTTSETESCTDVLIHEFQPDKVGLNHDNPSDFVRSQVSCFGYTQMVLVSQSVVIYFKGKLLKMLTRNRNGTDFFQ